MASQNIQLQRKLHPGRTDAEIASILAEANGYIAVVRYKNSPAAADYTDFGTCRTESEISRYLHSAYCQDPEIIYDVRSEAAQITPEFILAGKCELCSKPTTIDTLTPMAGDEFYICEQCASMFCENCYARLPLTGGHRGYGLCPNCRIQVQKAVTGYYVKQKKAASVKPDNWSIVERKNSSNSSSETTAQWKVLIAWIKDLLKRSRGGRVGRLDPPVA